MSGIKNIFTVLLTVICISLCTNAQAGIDDESAGYDVPAIIENGDTLPFWTYPVVEIASTRIFKDKSSEIKYYRNVKAIKKTLPIARRIAKEMAVYTEATKGMSDSKRKAYMKDKENNLVKKYKPELSKLSVRQSKYLIKLVDRECGNTSYELLQEFRGSFRAGCWQGLAKIMGTDLKAGYDKNQEKETEEIIQLIDMGVF